MTKAMRGSPDLSIVVPAYNEEHSIGACLGSLAHQNTDRSYEVILVDNNSTDGMLAGAHASSDGLEFAHRSRVLSWSRSGTTGGGRRSAWQDHLLSRGRHGLSAHPVEELAGSTPRAGCGRGNHQRQNQRPLRLRNILFNLGEALTMWFFPEGDGIPLPERL
jgi:GT2 family glycosyltransferase